MLKLYPNRLRLRNIVKIARYQIRTANTFAAFLSVPGQARIMEWELC